MAATGIQKISWQRNLSSPHKHVGIIAPDVSDAAPAIIAHRPHAPQAIGHRSEFIATTRTDTAALGIDGRLEYPEPRKAREVERQIIEKLKVSDAVSPWLTFCVCFVVIFWSTIQCVPGVALSQGATRAARAAPTGCAAILCQNPPTMDWPCKHYTQ